MKLYVSQNNLSNQTVSLIWLVFLALAFACNSQVKKEQIAQEKSQDEPSRHSFEHLPPSPVAGQARIIFFGNSITAGYGLNADKAFPALIQQKISELGLNSFRVVNAGNSGETTAGGKNRVEWVILHGVDIFVLELGGNDGLRGIKTEETYQNLSEIIDIVRKKNAEAIILLAGMQVPPNLGEEYTTSFKKIYPKLAKEKNVRLIPFILQGVGGNPEYNLSDKIHPNEQGHKIIADNVWKYLRSYLIIG
ncbi:arylesterase [Rapidithrix thailandica]|uniref:Arylesterase n=1 Tax=Rapidithrix thailandica TaxID=413964 RepID=A0AAW9RX85_9BACT